MAFFIVAFVVFIIALVLISSTRMIIKNKQYFEVNKQNGVGIVVGYDKTQNISSNSFICDLKIQIPEISESNVFFCKTNGVHPEDYPIGHKVRIQYVRKSGRLPLVEAHLVDAPPKVTNIALLLNKLGLALLLISCILTIIGFLVK